MIIVTAMLGIIFSLLFVFVGMTTELQGRQAIQEITEMSLRSTRRPEVPRPIDCSSLYGQYKKDPM